VTRIILIRHGETLWDIEKRTIGHLDIPLSDLGKKQSIAIAERLKNIPFTHLYSSDLGRAIQTAECISEICKLDIKIDPDLREINVNKVDVCVQYHQKQTLKNNKLQNKAPRKLDSTTPINETHRQRQDRIINIMNSLAHLHPNETIVVVSHSSILKGFLEFVIDVNSSCDSQFPNNNAAFNSFIKEMGTWSLEAWGEVDHLQGVYEQKSI